MNIRRSIILILLFLNCVTSFSQGLNNIWLSGYESFGGLPFGISRLNFFNGPPLISYDSLNMNFNHTHTNISDSSGNILFYTNGIYIADATNDTMQNGGSIHPGLYANTFPDGFLIAQGALVIPKPGSNTIYYLFHCGVDNYPNASGSVAYNLRMTTIDMSLNGGLGAVTLKNQVVINDTLNVGKITACKHANGRDWWVMVHRVNSNKFYKLIITPNVILGPYSQNIGSVRNMDDGQAKFSPDGSKFAYYNANSTALDIFDFNRCSGTLTNYLNDISIPINPGNVGCEFSPNSKVLYVSDVTRVYQYDLSVANIISSKTMVAQWDSFAQPGDPNLKTFLCNQELAPDGKIYITTGNSTTYFSTIESPDSIGMACNVSQHSVLLPTYYFNTLPNHPNYFLSCDSTLGCNCAVLTGFNSFSLPEDQWVKSYPNPTLGKFTLQFNVQAKSGKAMLYDVNGKLVLQEYIPAWSQYKYLDISRLSNGIYFCKLNWQNNFATIKIIKQ